MGMEGKTWCGGVKVLGTREKLSFASVVVFHAEERYLSSSQDGSGPGLGLRAGDFEASALCSL